MGVNVSNLFSSGLWAVLFHMGLAGKVKWCVNLSSLSLVCVCVNGTLGYIFTGIFALYYCFWIQLVSGDIGACRCRKLAVDCTHH